MSSVIILTQNKLSIEFWEQKLSIVSVPILKLRTVNAVMEAAPAVVIIDTYFLGHENLNWIEKQVAEIQARGYSNALICLSPQYTSMKNNTRTDDNVYRHHFNQSFIDRVSMAAV